MTLLDRSQLMTASGALLPSTNLDVARQTTTKGKGGGNAGVFMPIGAFFYVYEFSERIRLGVAAYSDYGLAGNYSKQWVGRYYLTRASLFTGKVACAFSKLRPQGMIGSFEGEAIVCHDAGRRNRSDR